MAEAGTTAQPAQQQTIILKSPLDRKQDVFDSEDFDPTKFINQIYPDGKLLANGMGAIQHTTVMRPGCCRQLMQLLVLLRMQRRLLETWIGLLECSRSRYGVGRYKM